MCTARGAVVGSWLIVAAHIHHIILIPRPSISLVWKISQGAVDHACRYCPSNVLKAFNHLSVMYFLFCKFHSSLLKNFSRLSRNRLFGFFACFCFVKLWITSLGTLMHTCNNLFCKSRTNCSVTKESWWNLLHEKLWVFQLHYSSWPSGWYC